MRERRDFAFGTCVLTIDDRLCETNFKERHQKFLALRPPLITSLTRFLISSVSSVIYRLHPSLTCLDYSVFSIEKFEHRACAPY
jgi:hypothetical protein